MEEPKYKKGDRVIVPVGSVSVRTAEITKIECRYYQVVFDSGKTAWYGERKIAGLADEQGMMGRPTGDEVYKNAQSLRGAEYQAGRLAMAKEILNRYTETSEVITDETMMAYLDGFISAVDGDE